MGKTWLILGENGEAKEAKIQAIKQGLLTSAEARCFDYEILWGAKLDPLVLQASLLALPTIGKQRVILIRDLSALNERCREIVAEAVAAGGEARVLVLEADDLDRKSAFFHKLQGRVELVDLKRPPVSNVFDMTEALARGNPGAALQVLAEMLSAGTHPLQIMGGVIWFWRKCQTRLTAGRYEKGLLFLQEADLNIKRSRLRPDYAVELLVVQLASLL